MLASAAWLATAPWGRGMEIDTSRIDGASFALPHLGLHDRYRAWKSFDQDAMNRLHEKGFPPIPPPRSSTARATPTLGPCCEPCPTWAAHLRNARAVPFTQAEGVLL